MKKVSLSGSPRADVGKKDAATLRSTGRVPAVLYGGEKQIHFHVDAIALGKIIYSPDVYQIDLNLEDTVYKCVIKDVQYQPVNDALIHLDLLEVYDNKPVVMGLPVRTVGASIGILNGGALSMNFRKIKVKGLLSDIPEYIQIDITKLRIGDKVRIADVDIPGCTLIQPEQSVIVAIRKTRVAMSLDAEEEEDESAEGTEEGSEGSEGAEASAETENAE